MRWTVDTDPMGCPAASEMNTTASASRGTELVRIASSAYTTVVLAGSIKKSGLMSPPAVSGW